MPTYIKLKKEGTMKDIIRAMDGLPKWAKVILALPVLDIVWAVYRLCRSIDKKSALGIILAILMLILCPVIFWLVDIITILVWDKVVWLD